MGNGKMGNGKRQMAASDRPNSELKKPHRAMEANSHRPIDIPPPASSEAGAFSSV